MSAELDLSSIAPAVRAWLAEDVGRGDLTTALVIPEGAHAAARLEARERFIVAGLGVAGLCFQLVSAPSPTFAPKVDDGDLVKEGQVLALVEGPLRAILTAERTALNILARLSGIATLTDAYVSAAGSETVRVVDTRKTTPGLRVLEKYAVRVGGGSNHRFGLDDGILIKDNHIAAGGGIGAAVRRAKRGAPHGLKVEVEVADVDGLREAVDAGADAVLLDNMSPEEVSAAVSEAAGRMLLEASGGVSLANIGAYADTGVDLVSVGALTHSAGSVDVALECEL